MKRNALQLLATFLLLLAMLTLSAPARAAQQDKPEPPKIIRKSGGVLQGSATKRVAPVYPPSAKAASRRMGVQVTWAPILSSCVAERRARAPAAQRSRARSSEAASRRA